MTTERKVKPPIGIIAQWRIKEMRIDDIDAAIERYREANYAIPKEWLVERYELLAWLNQHLPTSPYLKGFVLSSAIPSSESGGEILLEIMINELPQNRPLYKDSGLWQIRSDDMEDVIYDQEVNESFFDFIKRAFDNETPTLNYE
jgi:hypothetical protein